MNYKVVIEGNFWGKNKTFPSWNDVLAQYGRKPQIGNKTKQEMQMMCVNAIRRQLNVVIDRPIKLTYTFYEPDRKRDLGNLLFVDKIFEDALQVCGVIKNDNQNFVKGITALEVQIDKDNPRVEIEIEEIDNATDNK